MTINDGHVSEATKKIETHPDLPKLLEHEAVVMQEVPSSGEHPERDTNTHIYFANVGARIKAVRALRSLFPDMGLTNRYNRINETVDGKQFQVVMIPDESVAQALTSFVSENRVLPPLKQNGSVRVSNEDAREHGRHLGDNARAVLSEMWNAANGRSPAGS